MKRWLLGLLFVASCSGENRSAKSELPDNFPIRSVCYGVSQDLKEAVKVADEDASPIRLCANVQKDGHLGLDVRYLPGKATARYPVFALVTLQDGSGRSASEMFQMQSNPFSGAYEIYLTDGCLVGSFGGCTQSAHRKMQELFQYLQDRENSGGFEVSLAFVAVKGQDQFQWDLHDTLQKKNYQFKVKDL